MRLGRERGRGRRPGEAILINARVTVVAHAGERVQVHRELERRQLRLAADLPCGDLVDRRAEKIIRALGVLGEGRAQEPRVGRVVRARVGILQPRVGNDRHVVFDRFERRQNRRQLSKLRLARRSPSRVVASHRDEDEAEPRHRSGRRLRPGGRCGNHRVEQRQRQRGLCAFQKCPPGYRLLRDDHDAFLM